MKNPLCLSLDLDNEKKALDLASLVKDEIGCFKVGPRLVLRSKNTLIKKLSQLAPVFADFKFHDITSTLVASLQTVFDLNAEFATIHASCGKKTLKEVKKWEEEVNKIRKFKVLCVKGLTHLDESSFPSNWKKNTHLEHSLELCKDVMDSGLTGIVCPASHAKYFKEKYPESFLVTPGVRLEDSNDDQVHKASPLQALKEGSNLLVVGRPIYQNENPKKQAQKYLESIKDLL